MKRTLLTLAALSLLAGSACNSCGSCGGDKAADTKPSGKPKADPHVPQMPAPGSDADQRRQEALKLASDIDGQLSTFKHEEKPAAASPTGQQRKAEVWYVDGDKKKPKKLVLKDLDAGGAVQSETDMYFDDGQMLAYAKAPDGHFVFRMEGLALWLDPEQRVKRGIKPQDANKRANELKKDMRAALMEFSLR